jgi:DNA-directed RNA polymerase specialized sigma54-like protein
MTPQLQQAIRLLALSNMEIESFIAEEMDKKPLLDSGGGDDEAHAEPVEQSRPAKARNLRPSTFSSRAATRRRMRRSTSIMTATTPPGQRRRQHARHGRRAGTGGQSRPVRLARRRDPDYED